MSKLVSSNKGLTKVTAIIIAVVIVVVAVGGGIAWWYAAQTPGVRGFLVEDPDGDRMIIQVNPSRREAIEALTEMSKTGERKWVGGEIERFENEFGFRFKPDTIVVAEVTAEGLQASKYKYIQQDFEYWKGLGTIYISGKVVEVLK